MRNNRLLTFLCLSWLVVGNSSSSSFTPRHPDPDPLSSSSYPMVSSHLNWDGPSMLLIGLVDGSISAFSTDSSSCTPGPIWTVVTSQGPLVSSSLSGIELVKNGVTVQLIPALDGSLYSFDGERIRGLPVSADTLISSSVKISEDSIITGGKEVSHQGIDPLTGKTKYSCGVADVDRRPIKTKADISPKADEATLVISRLTQTVRALDAHQGFEKWNFSVGSLDVSFKSKKSDTCVKEKGEDSWKVGSVKFQFDVATGILQALSLQKLQEIWRYQFNLPITHAWMIDHGCVRSLNLMTFVPPFYDAQIGNEHDDELIFLSQYQSELFIQRAERNGFTAHRTVPEVKAKPMLTDGSRSRTRADAYQQLWDSDKALAKIDPVELGRGYVVTVAERPQNSSFVSFLPENYYPTNDDEKARSSVLSDLQCLLKRWLEYTGLMMMPLLIGGLGVYAFYEKRYKIRKPAIVTEVPNLDCQESQQSSTSLNSVLSLQSTTTLSRFCSDFEVIERIGKGGFGVVYLAKNRLDESMYAVKKIKLPQSEAAREKVRREVRVMAQLNHAGVVRFFNAWVEVSDPDPEVSIASETDEEEDSSQCESSFSNRLSAELCQDWIGTQRNRRSSKTRTDSLRYVPPTSVSSESDNVVFEAGDFSEVDGTSQRQRKKTASSSSKKSTPSLTGMSDIESDETDGVNPDPVKDKPKPQLFIQMELCWIQTLKDWLKINTEPRHRVHVLDIFYQIVSAVEYIHSKSLMHRDLKPSNILFSIDGNSVKIADFGLVTSMDDEEARHSLMPDHNYLSVQVHTNQVGTTLYMSPELLSGKPYDEKVDIYSLGLIFFELLVPFKTEMERIYAIKAAKDLRLDSALVSSCSQSNDEALLKELLSVNPLERPTASQIMRSDVIQELLVICGNGTHDEFGQGRKRTFSVDTAIFQGPS